MYIDFHKYNYNLVPVDQRESFIKRDKQAYEKMLVKWIENKSAEITDRKWEIEEIEYLSEVSDFIKLIREAESLYELEFFTSCIALVGVSAEDFLKYLAIKLGKPQYESQTQFNRSNNLLTDGLITQDIFDLLDNIRIVRNNCLHYNQDFKTKNTIDLKTDALKVLNDLKSILKSILGVTTATTSTEFLDLIKELSNPESEDSRNFDEIKMKLRNASSHILKFPIAFEPSRNLVVKQDFFLVREIDFDMKETTITSVLYEMNATVIVELNDEIIEHIKKTGIKENDTIYASVFSQPNNLGMTEEWNFFDLRKEENFTEIFHDFLNSIQ
jgi:hypothetical protein